MSDTQFFQIYICLYLIIQMFDRFYRFIRLFEDTFLIENSKITAHVLFSLNRADSVISSTGITSRKRYDSNTYIIPAPHTVYE